MQKAKDARSRTGFLLATLAVCLCLGVLWMLLRRESVGWAAFRQNDVDPFQNEPTSTPHDFGVATQENGREVAGRVPDSEPPSAQLPDSLSSSETLVRGCVIDILGRGLPGIEVGLVGSAEPRATSADDGSFEMSMAGPGSVIVQTEGFVTAAAGIWPQPGGNAPPVGEPEIVVIAARGVLVAGFVVDEIGAGVAGARLRIEVPDEIIYGLGQWTARAQRLTLQTTSTDRGAFRFDAAPSEADLWVEATGFKPRGLRLLPGGDPGLVLELQRTTDGPDTLSGIVLDVLGYPVEEAKVSAGGLTVLTNAAGKFLLPRQPPKGLPILGESRELIALKRGYLPAFAPMPVGDLEETLVLILEGEPRSISGRVLDESGKPLAGIFVQPWDRTSFGMVDAGPGNLRPANAEDLIAGEAGVGVRTDATGKFDLQGLLDREYRLEAIDEAHLLLARTGPIPAGARGVRISLSARGMPLVGRVVDLAGQPAAGVNVTVALFSGGASRESSFFGMIEGPSHVTGADGSFWFDAIGRAEIVLHLQGAAIVPRTMIPLEDMPGPLELTIARRCSLRVLRSAPGEMLRAEVVDARGRPLSTFLFEGGGFREQPWFIVPADGHSPVVGVSEEGAELLLRTKAGAEQRRTLFLDPERLVEIPLD